MSELNGKTIAEVIDRGSDYGGIDLIFTDGTAIRIEGDGYDTSTVTTSDLTAEDREREAREKIEQAEEARLAAIVRAEREAEEAEAKASLSPEDFLAWMNEHRPGWRIALLMKQEFDGVYADMLRATKRMLVSYDSGGHVGAITSIPIWPSS